MRELANAMSYSYHAPDKISAAMQDVSELKELAEAEGLETEAWWDES